MASVRVTCPHYTPVLGGMLSLLVSCKNAATREMERGGFCRLPMPILLVPQATVQFPSLCMLPLSSPFHSMSEQDQGTHQYISDNTLKYYALYSANPGGSNWGEQLITIAVEQTYGIVTDYLLRAESVCGLCSREDVLVA